MSFIEFRSSALSAGDRPMAGLPSDAISGFDSPLGGGEPIIDGPFAGLTLVEAIATDAARILGPRWDPQRPLPLTLDRLALSEGQKIGPLVCSRPADGEDDRSLLMATKADFGARLMKGDIHPLFPGEELESFGPAGRPAGPAAVDLVSGDGSWLWAGQVWAVQGPVDLLRIGPGRSHIVGPGDPKSDGLEANLSPDHSPDVNGKLKLHLAGKFDVGLGNLRLRRIVLRPGDEWVFKAAGQARILVLIGGSLRLNFQKKIAKGAVLMLCYGWMNTVQAEEISDLLLVDEFASESNIFTGR